LALVAATACAALFTMPLHAATLTVCVEADNPPLSYQRGGQLRGLDRHIAEAAAQAMGRPLALVPFESDYERDANRVHEVNALLSAGVCDAVSAYPLLAGDLGPPSRVSARVPDHPGAPRQRERPHVPLQPVAATRAYQAAWLGMVLPAQAPAVRRLTDLGTRRLAVTSGSLAGSLVARWHGGALRPQLVSLGLREDGLAELARPASTASAGGRSPRFDALLLPLAAFDGWKLLHPNAPLVAAEWRAALGLNLGFVTLASAAETRAAIDGVIAAARADGRLARWAAEEGVSWTPPALPDVASGGPATALPDD
jgi:hypothetical protein